MLIETIPVGAVAGQLLRLRLRATRQAIVIDPGDEAEAILAALDQHELTLTRILATHAHFDHLLACRALQERTGAPFYLHPADRPLVAAMHRTCMAWLGYDPGAPPDIAGDLTPGETIQVGDIALEVRHTPGHSPGSVTLVDHAGRRAFTGDALFAGSIGRTDLPGGDMRTLLDSIRSQILTLPDDYAVLLGPWRSQHRRRRATRESVSGTRLTMDEGRTTKDGEGAQAIPAHQAIFRMSAEIAAQIIEHAQSGYPDEVCGLVAGRDGVATAVYPGRNISPTPADDLRAGPRHAGPDDRLRGRRAGARRHLPLAPPRPRDPLAHRYRPRLSTRSQSTSSSAWRTPDLSRSVRGFRIAQKTCTRTQGCD